MQAEKADPRDPLYPSNLSAALFEMGDYAGSASAVLRSWHLLQERQDMKADLVIRLSTRLARALCHGARAGTPLQELLTRSEDEIEQLQVVAAERLSVDGNVNMKEEWRRAWKDWETVRAEMAECVEKGEVCSSGLSRLPVFCKPLWVAVYISH